jgi:hypothetical protein
MDLQDNQNIDVEALLQQIDAPAPERPMSGPEETPPTDVAPQTPPPVETPPVIQEYEFDWNGRKIKAPIEKLTKWASQGYDYSQKMESFKAKQAEIEEKAKLYQKYQQVDEYVKKDPNWWAHVEESWTNRLASEDPVVQRVKGMLEEQLTPFKEMLAQKEESEKAQKISQEDTALQTEMKSIREKYKDLDFDTPDAEGKSLEHKVLEHGARNNFPSFKAAFLDFYHDQLEKMWEARGREAVSKDAEKRQKLGLSASTPTPKKALADGFDVKGKSYNDLQQEIFERLGL